MKWFTIANRTCLVIYWAALFTGTHLPGAALDGIQTSDKLLHFLGYAGLATLLTMATLPAQQRLRRATVVFAALMAYAAFDEWSQQFVAGRISDVGDWIADTCGSLFGIVCGMIASWLVQRGWGSREAAG